MTPNTSGTWLVHWRPEHGTAPSLCGLLYIDDSGEFDVLCRVCAPDREVRPS